MSTSSGFQQWGGFTTWARANGRSAAEAEACEGGSMSARHIETPAPPHPVGAGAGTPAVGSPPGSAAGPDAPGAGMGGEPVSAPGDQPRTWRIAFPAGLRLLSLNDRKHWAEKGRITRDLRAAGCVLARQQRIPPLARARVTVEYQPPLVTRRRDLDNVATASGKPAIDGALRDSRVLLDDSPQYLTEVTYRIGEPYPKGRLVLTITEVTP